MDLEWNRSYDKKRLDEILQIGAVRVERPGGRILSTFCAYIKPHVHNHFDPGARKLPELQRSIESETTFAEAWTAFTGWCGDERVFAFWGPDDFGVMRQNCVFWGLPVLEPEKVYDLQRAFAHACGVPATRMALWRVVGYLGLPDIFDFHTALYDAMYTALVGAWLRQEDLDYAPPKRVKHPPLKRGSHSKQPAVAKIPGTAAEPKKHIRRRKRRHRKANRGDTAQSGSQSSA